MSKELRAKLAQNTTDQPIARAAETFSTAATPNHTAKRARTTFYIPDPILRGLKFLATDRDTTVNDLVLTAINEYIANHPDTQHWFNRPNETTSPASPHTKGK